MDPNHARQLLATRRADIERELTRLLRREDDGRADASDPGDAVGDLFETELDEGLVEQLRRELGAIERAEKRLADGTYGVSIDSGEPIPDARLEIVPWAERTAAEQARYDLKQR